MFIGRTDVEAETPILDAKYLMRRADSFEKTLMLGKTLKVGGEGEDRG